MAMIRFFRQFFQKHAWAALSISLMLAASFGLPALETVQADEIQQKKEQLKNLNEQISEQRKKVQETQNQANGITAEITTLAKKIEASEWELVELAQDIDTTKKDIQIKEQKLQELQEKIKRAQGILGERLCIIYEEGECNYLDVLLQSASLQDFLTRVDYLNAILDNDQLLIAQTNECKDEVEVQKKALEHQKAQLEQQKNEEAATKQALEQEKAAQQVFLDAVYAEKDNLEKALQEIENESAMLEGLIRNLESQASAASIVHGTGVLMWPSNNHTITSDYGMRFHPTLKRTKLHTGIDIGAGYGADIFAADSGTVIFAGWNNAYGKMVIINHGGNLSTVYAHQSSILVSEGQNVQRGQVIGRVGSTGWSTGPLLHFEVRVNGSVVNPHNYVG